jgi:hypothetical protein
MQNTTPNSGGLFRQLMQRAQQGQGQPASAEPSSPPTAPSAPSTPLPAVMPNPHTKTPPAMERFRNGQAIQQAYANGWQPNPVLLRAALGR